MNKCLVCLHENRGAIEEGILSGETFREMASTYGISISSISRHKTKCIPTTVQAALTSQAVASGFDTLDRVQNIAAKAERLQDLALQDKDLRAASMGLREERGAVELYAKLKGELDSGTWQLQWPMVRDALIEALRPYPEAWGAVSAAIAGLSLSAPRLPASNDED